jgi:hypothetical protein
MRCEVALGRPSLQARVGTFCEFGGDTNYLLILTELYYLPTYPTSLQSPPGQ